MPCLRRRGKAVHGGSRRSIFQWARCLIFVDVFLSTREGQKSGAWELLQVFVFCNIPVLVARYRTSCEKMFPRLSFSVYRTARGRSELIPCITLKNHLTRFNLVFRLIINYQKSMNQPGKYEPPRLFMFLVRSGILNSVHTFANESNIVFSNYSR